MSFWKSYGYSDIVLAQTFEGVPQKVEWTEKEMDLIKHSQIIGLTATFNDYGRKLIVSKALMHPLRDIKNIIDGYTNDEPTYPQYRLYSAHDRQIVNILNQLKPELDTDFIPYASAVYFELFRVKNYKDDVFQNYSYKVRFVWDGKNVDLLKDCGKYGFCDG